MSSFIIIQIIKKNDKSKMKWYMYYPIEYNIWHVVNIWISFTSLKWRAICEWFKLHGLWHVQLSDWLIYYYCWICLYYWYFVAVLAVLATTIFSAFYSCCVTCAVFFYAFCFFACAVYFWFLLHSWAHCPFCLGCYAFLATKALKAHLVCSFVARAVI